MGLDHPAQLFHTWGDLQRIGALQVQTAVTDGGEWVAAKPPLRPPGHLIELPSQALQDPIGLGRKGQGRVGGRALLGPLAFLGQQVPERDVSSALRQVQVARAQRVTDRQRQGDLPEVAGGRPFLSLRGCPPGCWDESSRGLQGEFVPLPTIQARTSDNPSRSGSAPVAPSNGRSKKDGR